MKAMIFAAGLGTRLYPITATIPKALVEVGGKPMLGQVLGKLPSLGIDDVVVNVHHHADKVAEFLSAYNTNMNIKISDERDCLLDTGGGVVKAMAWLRDEEVLLHNADILTDVSLEKMIKQHYASAADVTLLVSERATSRYLFADENMLVRGWTNVNTGQVLPLGLNVERLQKVAFGGIHLLSPKALSALELYGEGKVAFSITNFYIDSVNSLNIRCFMPQEKYMWYDIGKPTTLEAARMALEVEK